MLEGAVKKDSRVARALLMRRPAPFRAVALFKCTPEPFPVPGKIRFIRGVVPKCITIIQAIKKEEVV
jgi:hypothetical protein